MPSLKPVRSLFDLSLCATRDLVISTAKNIEDSYPCDLGLSYDVPGCSDAVLPMQGRLRDLLPVTVYESLFQAVSDHVSDFETDISDHRILFSTLISDNANLKKLTLEYRWFTEYGSGTYQWEDDEVQILKNQRHVEFWLKQVPKLVNLVDLNLQKVTNDKLILAFIRTCTELKRFTFWSFVGLSSATLLSVYQTLSSCTKLQRFERPLNQTCVEEFMTTLAVAEKWTIRNLFLSNFTSEQVLFLINLCPNLVDLTINSKSEDYEETMQILASCPQKFYKLSVDSRDDHPEALSNLLSSKGIHIRDLTIVCWDSGTPLELLYHVGETCGNLVVLEIISDWDAEDQPEFGNVIQFPNLERLEIARCSSGNQLGLVAIAKHCLANAPNVTSLALGSWSYEEESEEEVIQLFTSNQRTKQLTDLKISGRRLSKNLSTKIFEWCTNLKSIVIGNLSAEAERYFANARDEIKLKNLDISLCFY